VPANPDVGSMIATTLELRSQEFSDEVSESIALWSFMAKSGNVKPAPGGTEIWQEIMEGEVENVQAYTGSEQMELGGYDGLTAAKFAWKLVAGSVQITGSERLQNASKQQMINLLDSRMTALELSMKNFMGRAMYGDGTEFGGKSPGGLGLLVVTDPTTGTVGGINRATNPFWRNYSTGLVGPLTKDTIQDYMMDVWVNTSLGNEHPTIISAGNEAFTLYSRGLQADQRFTDPALADRGFTNIRFMGVPVILDGGIGGAQDSNVMHFLNTKYIYARPHPERNFVAMGGDRVPVNQDLVVRFMGWYGNFTVSSMRRQGKLDGNQ